MQFANIRFHTLFLFHDFPTVAGVSRVSCVSCVKHFSEKSSETADDLHRQL
jgi:hypothetical protein